MITNMEWQCCRCMKWFPAKEESIYCSGACAVLAEVEVPAHQRVPKMRLSEADTPELRDGTKYDLWVNRRWTIVHTMEYQCMKCGEWTQKRAAFCSPLCTEKGYKYLRGGKIKLRYPGVPDAGKHKHKNPLKPKPEGVS